MSLPSIDKYIMSNKVQICKSQIRNSHILLPRAILKMYCFCTAGMPIRAISSDLRGCGRRQGRAAAALAFSSTCGKMMVDSRKRLDKAGLFESYLGKCPRHPAIRP